MALHRLIADTELPEPLLKKLEFGNRDQINALDDLSSIIDDRSEVKSGLKSGKLSKYGVEISYSGSQYYHIIAPDKASAIEKAMEEFTVDDTSIEIDSKSAAKISLTPTK